jgi:hypothetical protein
MLHMACRAVGTRSGVSALFVTRIATSLPLGPLPAWMDQAGEEALDHAEVIAHQYGTELDTRLTRARRPIDAILMLARAGEQQAIFLPMYSGHRPWIRLRVTLTAWAVRRHANCPILAGEWGFPLEQPEPARAFPFQLSTY